MDKGLGRELLIILLLFLVVVFTLVILMYDFLQVKKVEEVSSAEYSIDDSVIENVLKEIKDSTGVDVKEKVSDVPLKSYSIEAKDLNMYASDNSYESGKSDPFAENPNPAEELTKTIPKSSNAVEARSSTTVTNKPENTTTSVNNTAIENKTNNVVKSTTNNTVNTVKTNTVTNKTVVVENSTKSNTTTGVYFEERDTK